MRRNRLLFVSNLFPDSTEPYRGLDNAMILHQLSSQWDIEVLALRPSLQAWLGRNADGLRPRQHDVRLAPRYLLARYVPKVGGWFNHLLMRRLLLKHAALQSLRGRFDIILAAWLYPDGWAAEQLAAALKLPLVLIAQGSDVHRYLRLRPRRKLLLDAVGKSHAVITRSRSLSRLLQESGAEASHLHVVHNGVDSAVFHPGNKKWQRQELGVDENETVLLFVGNLLPVKHPLLLVRAFAKVCHRKTAWSLRLVMAGKGPLRVSIEKLADRLGVRNRVTLLGPLHSTQVAAWMRAADLLCLTSRNEGLPNVVLEAMACGLPVLATDVGGIHEVLDESWKGRLVSEGDEDAFAAAMEDLLEHPPDTEKIASYGHGLSWQTTAAAYQNIVHSALQSSLIPAA